MIPLAFGAYGSLSLGEAFFMRNIAIAIKQIPTIFKLDPRQRLNDTPNQDQHR